ncbi:MAG: DinB family protein, partial [Pseudomonadota bacterium]|nr:DinB family protein [Pseudomonadota bacterium]
MLAHPHVLAGYNAWANRRLHGICAELSADKISQDRGAFFGSILGTLNHVLLVDILYRERIEGIDSTFSGLNDTLHSDLSALSVHQ